MCGRYTLSTPGDVLAEELGLAETPELRPRYNIAPTQDAPVVGRRDAASPRRLDLLRWGLVPRWADDPSIGNRLINARSETVAERNAFAESFRHRRCLVPADGFLEWRREGRIKQPYHLRPAAGGILTMAGLWDAWRGPEGDLLSTFTVLTRPADDTVAPIHDRMPVILPKALREPWLDPESEDPEGLLELLRTVPDAGLEAVAVSTRVNDVRNDDPECLREEPRLFR